MFVHVYICPYGETKGESSYLPPQKDLTVAGREDHASGTSFWFSDKHTQFSV